VGQPGSLTPTEGAKATHPHNARNIRSAACRHLTVIECRPPWHADVGPEWTRLTVARLTYTKSNGTWTLSYRDRNLRFHHYHQIPPIANISELLNELAADPTSIFWGLTASR
jgi:hypothetical protein